MSTSLFSDYNETLGEGRFGICKKVYLQGCPICVKEVKSVSHAKQLVLHEASALLKLCHQSVCYLLGIQTDCTPYFLVLNLYTVDGFSVNVHDFLTISSSNLTHESDPTPKQCVVKSYYATLNLGAWLKIMIKIAEGLHFIHEQGIIHRDLKTDNVVFYEHSKALQPVIVDFGKCEYISHSNSYLLADAEKEEYRKKHKHVAPDLVDGISKSSPASDVYSYGRIFKNIICYFPLKASEVPISVKNTVRMCLKYESVDRPSCRAIIELFTNCINKSV